MAATVLATMDTGYYLVHTKLLLNIFVCFFFVCGENERKNKQTNKQINEPNQTKPNLNPNKLSNTIQIHQICTKN